jgi:hypothetical protein
MAEPAQWDIPTDLQLKEPSPRAEAVPDLWDTSIAHPDLPAEVTPGQPDKPVADPGAAPAYLELAPRRLPWQWPVLPQ